MVIIAEFLELAVMESFVIFKIWLSPSNIDPRPFSMIQQRSCSISFIGVLLGDATVQFQSKEIIGAIDPKGKPGPVVAPFKYDWISRIFDENKLIDV